jgi:hypothetical protein
LEVHVGVDDEDRRTGFAFSAQLESELLSELFSSSAFERIYHVKSVLVDALLSTEPRTPAEPLLLE